MRLYQRALKTYTELLLRCCYPCLNNSSPCIPPSSHLGRYGGRGGGGRPGLQLSYLFHSRVVNAPPVFSVDIAFGQNRTQQEKGKKKEKKDRQENKKKKNYIVHNVNKCMLIYLGGNYTWKDLCPNLSPRPHCYSLGMERLLFCGLLDEAYSWDL